MSRSSEITLAVGSERMRMRMLLLAALALAACSAAPAIGHDGDDAPADAPKAIDAVDARVPVTDDPCFPAQAESHRVYECNGLVFDVEVPAACVNGGCGLILDVHGLTMSAAMEDANTQLRARAGAAGYIVIQPSATPAPPQSAWKESDDAAVYDFLTRAIAVYAVDANRVHITGFSQGGFMTWRFLCQHADVFASVAPAAAASSCPVVGNPSGIAACKFTGDEVPSRKLSILYMHGRADQNYIPYSCAQPQLDAIAAAWNLTALGVVASSSTYTRTRWTDNAGTIVEHLAHDYTSDEQVPFVSSSKLQGHCFPGSTDPGGQPGQLFSFKCEQPASFVWGDEVVTFFMDHPRI